MINDYGILLNSDGFLTFPVGDFGRNHFLLDFCK